MGRPVSTGGMGIEHGRAAASRDLRKARGARRDSLIEAETVVATEAVAGPGEASPGTPETETRDAIAAEQEAAGPCRKTRRGRRKRRHGNCIFGAQRSNAGSHRPRRRTADRPAKLNRTPARAADAAPGAVDFPPVPAEKTSRGASGVAPAHGASSGLQLTELINTRSLTGRRTPAIAFRPREDVTRPFAGDGEGGKLEGGCGARPELRPEAPAGGARRRLNTARARRAPTRSRRSRTRCTIFASRACGRPG